MMSNKNLVAAPRSDSPEGRFARPTVRRVEFPRSTLCDAPVRPHASEVFTYAERQVLQSAAELWPGVPIVLEQHVPSVTGYVQRLRVGGRSLFAKLSFLGVSLVSLLNGACGQWEKFDKLRRITLRGLMDCWSARPRSSGFFAVSAGHRCVGWLAFTRACYSPNQLPARRWRTCC